MTEKAVAANAATPFAGLTPECMLDAVEALGLPVDGRLQALNSYENRVWQFGLEGYAPVVAKFYRPARWTNAQILEEHAFLAEMVEAELPVVAPMRIKGDTLHKHAGFRFAVFPYQGGRAPEFADPEVLEWMGRLMARVHNAGARRTFEARPQINAESFGREPRDWLLRHHAVPADLEPVWRGVADQALDEVANCYLHAGGVRLLRLHGDCHAGNVLWTPAAKDGSGGGPHFVDFDDARGGPAVQDLWMLLSGEAEEMAGQLQHLLDGYEVFREFDWNEVHLVEALRTLRLLHHAYWLARRWDDPAFPAAFPWFATPRYWEDRVLELREQIARMQESALATRFW